MSRPTNTELKLAIERAAWLREHDEDEFFLGKSLLNHNYRLKHLEHVLSAAKMYLHSGDGTRELSDLLKAIEKAEETEYRPGEDHFKNQDVVI